MKRTLVALLLLGMPLVSSATSLVDELKSSSTGTVTSKFRGGYFLGAGYQGRIGGTGDTKIQGLVLEGGVYGLFNPIRNFFDVEVGLSGKYNPGVTSTSGNSGKKTYYAGLTQVTIYGGTVFRFGETDKALAVGVSKALYIDEVQTDELIAAGIQKHDLENGVGVYVEYQSGGDQIFCTRIEIEQIDVVDPLVRSKDTIANVIIGMKF